MKSIVRKLISALFSTLILGFVYFLIAAGLGGLNSAIYTLIVLMYASVGNLVYGIPVSYLSDILTKKLNRYRFIAAAFIHIFFGFITIFFLSELTVWAVGSALLFFLMDEIQKIMREKFDKKIVLLNGLTLLGFACLSVYGSMSFATEFEEKTNEYYIIPAGYTGQIQVLYNIKYAPQPEKIGNYNVIEINEKGYGITRLSQGEGIIENKYFYEDKEGNKEKIDEKCIYLGGSGTTSGDGYEYSYSDFMVTNSGCGEDFMLWGDDSLPQGLTIEDILLEEGLAEIVDDMIEPKRNIPQ
ncbi:hypothetical protein [Bacillus sp. V59.32b]|uniref:DUF6843 domain-containing protein n=1 Tax=Bacillus sp. V59.32b TaxID=1758642 RepID=UPI000E3BDEB7|nr:hypothetical protein [Bacillus sp. V59.32b]RFU64199.1 hypothetical protein D0463_10765 [Bacillus sp. V59.32b]